MAVRTPDASAADVTGAREANAWQLRKFPFAAVANDDTFASGITNIRRVAWEPDGVGDPVAATFATTGIVTFNSPGTEAGTLHVWSGADR